MERILVDDLINDVRITIDENVPESSYLFETTDNLELDDIIRNKLIDAVRLVFEDAPLSQLEPTNYDTSSAQETFSDGSGLIVLPEDFLRLVGLKLETWSRVVSSVHIPESATDLMQHNKYVRGSHIKPRCVFGHNTDGERAIYYYTAGKDSSGAYDHSISHFHYIPIPAIEEGDNGETIAMPTLLRFAVVNYCAGLTLVTRGMVDAGNQFINLATTSFS